MTSVNTVQRQFHFISIHPKFIESYFSFGVFSAASKNQLVELSAINLRDFAEDKHKSVDAPPCGGGDGMVLSPVVLSNAIKSIKFYEKGKTRVVLPCPKGKRFSHQIAQEFVKGIEGNIIFICGRFAGIDERFIENYVTDRVSLGDFVLSGGELASLVMADSMLRLVPGALGNETSSQEDSFGDAIDGRLEYPLYTKPTNFEGKHVPEVLLSGDHQKIKKWRMEQSVAETKKYRPDLLR